MGQENIGDRKIRVKRLSNVVGCCAQILSLLFYLDDNGLAYVMRMVDVFCYSNLPGYFGAWWAWQP
ncbi:hypothetical protein D3C78_1039710 [compost metagenome]